MMGSLGFIDYIPFHESFTVSYDHIHNRIHSLIQYTYIFVIMLHLHEVITYAI
jgi:hypothetical protein